MAHGKKPLTLAIIIPVYNDERYLSNCLNSLAAQSVMPNEVIVVDNNCTDDSIKIAKSYSFVSVVKEKHQGVYYARTKGFNSAKSEILARIDSDSILKPDWVEKIKDFYSEKSNLNKALTGGGFFYNVRSPKINGWVLNQIMIRFNRLLIGHYILWGSNMAMLRSQWQAVKSSTCSNPMIHEDIDLAIHLHEHGVKIAYRSDIRVGVLMRRVFSDWSDLKPRLEMWPITLKAHNKGSWFVGSLGAKYLYSLRKFQWIERDSSK